MTPSSLRPASPSPEAKTEGRTGGDAPSEARAAWIRREEGAGWHFRLMRWLGARAPAAVMEPAIWLVSLIFALRRRRPATRASEAYLARALGRPPTLSDRHRHARCFAHVFLDRVRLLSRGAEGFQIDVSHTAGIEKHVAAGRGAVLLGAHFGSFEALRAFERTLPGLRVRPLMFTEHAARSTALLNELNPQVAAQVISLSDGPAAMMAVTEALRAGDCVAFLGDRQPTAARRGAVSAPFLGGAIAAPTSPYVAAISAKAPLIFCAAARVSRRRYAIYFRELYDGSPIPRRDRSARIAALAADYAALLEDLCRRHPYNWFNFFDIWSSDLRDAGDDGRSAEGAPGGARS